MRNAWLSSRARADLVHRKSQLAIEYAYQVRDESQATWVFWVHAGTHERFKEGYRRIAEATKMDGWDDPKANVLRLVRNWLNNESNGRWLIVVDNADDEAVFFQDAPPTGSAGSSEQPTTELLCDFLPQSPNGSILITSRSRDAAYKLTGSYSSIIEVKHMNKDAALALLEKKLGCIDNEDEAVQLIQALDAMPLAITQAAAFINMRGPRMSVSRYVDEVRGRETGRARLLNKDVGDSRRDGRASNSIIATWHISFKYIQTNTPNAARLLSLMSLFDRQGIPESLLHDWYLEHGGGGADFDDDMDVLTSFSLVEMSKDESEFEMHRLVQFSTKKWLELNCELEKWKKTYVLLMDKNYPFEGYESWSVCQKLLPHAEIVLNSEPEDTQARKAWASLMHKSAWYACEMGLYSKSYDMYYVALQARETIFGLEHQDTLISLICMGDVVRRLGRHEEAETIQKKGLEKSRQVLGADHPTTLVNIANLAMTHYQQRRWKDAEKLFMQVIKMSKTKFGADHFVMVKCMGNLASTYRRQKRLKDAEELYMQVIEMSKTKLGVDHVDTLESMGNLAETYRKQGRSRDAEELFMQVLETHRTKFGLDHPFTLTSIGYLASTYKDQGRWKDAKELQMTKLEMSKTKLGADHPITLTSMENLAYTFQAQGKINEAISLMQDCCALCVKVLGPEHFNTVLAHKRLTRWRSKDTLVSK